MAEQKYLPRLVDSMLKDKLSSTGAVCVRGPKWCGKTRTSLQLAKSVLYMQDPDTRTANMQMAELKPSLLLQGQKPRLIDEWQEAPQLWDAVRFSVDKDGGCGLYILTGSATPKEKPRHSGTGRIARLTMRPMTLFESLESTGEVSLKSLFEGKKTVGGFSDADVETLAFQIARGGWPSSVAKSLTNSVLETPYDYVQAVVEEDISDVDGVKKNPDYAKLIMAEYARCSGSQAEITSLSRDVGKHGAEISRPTVTMYLSALRNLSVLEDLSAWEPSLRAKSRITKTPKRYFVDPSLAMASLGASPQLLLKDVPTLGLLFESMCIRDLRVYSEKLHGSVFFYHDATGLEADAVTVLNDGRWGLIEIKLSPTQVEDAAKTLQKVAKKIDTEAMGEPSFLLVLTSGGYAYQRPDGVCVAPLSTLRD